jgi:hypothetical protein
MENWNWPGNWWIGAASSGFFTNASVSSNVSAALYGLGSGTSAYESDWYSMPNITGLNPLNTYKFRFRLASYRFTSTGATSGTDVGDYTTVQLSTDGGITYINELRVTGNNNSYWSYSSTAVASKTANGLLTVFGPTGGGDRTSTGDGYSIIELTLPSGSTQCAVDIFCRANAAGEEWWIDNIELIEYYSCIPLPIELLSFQAEKKDYGIFLTWETATELNNDYFLLQRSMDCLEWEHLYVIESEGNSLYKKEYNYLDGSPKDGFNYYRLSQFDLNGESETFDIIQCEWGNSKNECKFEYYDMNGKQVDINKSPAGIYLKVCKGKIVEKIWKN